MYFVGVAASVIDLRRVEDSLTRFLHDLGESTTLQQLADKDDSGDDVPEPLLDVLCRALPVATLGKGATARPPQPRQRAQT